MTIEEMRAFLESKDYCTDSLTDDMVRYVYEEWDEHHADWPDAYERSH